jgi:hypothetical protein
MLHLPVSYGEAIDKLTILDIKMDKIKDSRREDVENEYRALYTQLRAIVQRIDFYYKALKQINLQIWNDQDTFRYSSNQTIKNKLCSKIIEDNDARFRIKHKINKILCSFLKEQKGYNPNAYHIQYADNIDSNLLESIIKYQSIFNDKVVIHCSSTSYDICNTYNHDSMIEVTLDACPHDSTIELLYTDIRNKEFFEFIQNTITNGYKVTET